MIRPGSTVKKDRDAILFYTFDWSNWLVGEATLDSATFAVDDGPDAALTLSNDSIISDDTAAKVLVTGGTPGGKYLVRCRIVTDEVPSQTDDRAVWIKVT
jgi:hypothetical protein